MAGVGMLGASLSQRSTEVQPQRSQSRKGTPRRPVVETLDTEDNSPEIDEKLPVPDPTSGLRAVQAVAPATTRAQFETQLRTFVDLTVDGAMFSAFQAMAVQQPGEQAPDALR
mmetsp:Transcript_42327/g.89619  ORF Transcript_42327/g.89619 Transcript_42327/m.89619 type:complete len:113 (-) Transcript_42327:24-362(-)